MQAGCAVDATSVLIQWIGAGILAALERLRVWLTIVMALPGVLWLIG